MRVMVFLLAVLLLSLTACVGGKTTTEPVQYPMEVRDAVVEEAIVILETRGFWPDIVAGIGAGIDSINLAFYAETNTEVVEIVQSVIDELALGLPLDIVENVTIVTPLP